MFARPDAAGITPRPALSPRAAPTAAPDTAHPVIEAKQFRFYYGAVEAIRGIDLPIAPRSVTAIIGPSGCGKSTFLRSINRLNDLIPGTRYDGELLFDGQSILAPDDGPGAAPAPDRHGVPEAESVSQVDLRQRGVRSRTQQAGPQAGSSRPGGALPPPRGALGRSEGPARRAGHRPVGRDSSSGSASRARWATSPRCC